MKIVNTCILLVLIFLAAQSAQARDPEGDRARKSDELRKTLKNDAWDFISVNNILMWISNNGRTAHNPTTDASGLEWPKGSAKYAIFTDGLIWGGKIQGQTRVGGATYVAGLQAGWIKSDGTASDPNDPKNRIFKIRKVDSLGLVSMTATERDRLQKDFTEWPIDIGAPWVDRNKNGKYDPDFADWLMNGDTCRSDVPLLPGDETLWFISNDLDPRRTRDLYGSAPIGIEVHTLVWAYTRTGPLSNMVFTKYTLINKGTSDIEQAYLSKWSDPDLGDAFDDFVGIDTTLSLGFVYNGLAKDEVYGIPPAAGYDFFQGPIIASTGDSARFKFGIRQGYKNLPVSTFAFYINGSSTYADPDLHVPLGTEMMYNYMEGFLWNRRAYIDPTTGQTVKVCLPGDPVTRTGWVDGIVSTPGDRRFLMTAGPFTLKTGDTQEVVVSTIIGQGSDRLSSLKVLKYYDKFAQLAFDNNFDLPKAPPSPSVKLSLQRNEVVLTWGDPESISKVEQHNDRGYKFQGYNVYQFPKKSSILADGIRIATYDISDGVGVIFDEFIDEKSGIVLDLPAQYGSDGGIQRMQDITKDLVTDRPLVNNQPYYYAVTAYAFNPDPGVSPRQLESTPVILEARPQITNPGVRFGEPFLSAPPAVHTSGTSTGYVDVVAVDPLQVTGDTYEVSFASSGTIPTEYDYDLDGTTDTTLILPQYDLWNVTNVTRGKKMLENARGYNGLQTDFVVIDGLKIGVTGTDIYRQFDPRTHDPGLPLLHHDEILKRQWMGGPEVFTPYEKGAKDSGRWWEMGYVGGFGSALRGYTIDKIVEIRFDTTKPSKGYMFMRGIAANYSCQGYYNSPIQVWDVTSADHPRQLAYAWVEQFGVASNDHMWAPTDSPNDREMLFILDETYSETPNPTWMDPAFRINTMGDRMPILYWSWYLLKPEYKGRKFPWANESKWVITPSVAFSSADRFTITTLPPVYDQETAKRDISQINVFPNPYLGANAREQNKYQRFVTFNHLPNKAHFRIFSVSGTLVRSFSKKEDGTQYSSWDLMNDNSLPVGSGLYYIHIDMPELGEEKILKLAVVMETQFLDRI
jgi:hypothetical protein